jgi:signal transduction histidine kinase
MTGILPAARSGGVGWVDLALVALTVVLALLTGIVFAVPAVAPAIVNDRLDLGIQTSASLVAFAVAALAFARGRVSRDTAALLRGSAFAVLGLLNAMTLGVMLVGAEAAVGGSLDDPGQLPLLAGVIARGTCAALLVVAGVLAVRRTAQSARPALMLVAPPLLVGIAIAIAALAQDRLPPLASQAALDQLVQDPAMPLNPASAPALVLLQGAIGAAFMVAAALAHRSFRTSGRTGDALLAAGLLIAAVSQVHSALHPGSYISQVTSGDLLRLAFYGALLAGIVVDSRDDLRELRAANIEVQRLAQAQLVAVKAEERARIAREIHDGLAQDLWYAKLKHSRLAQLLGADGDSRTLSGEVADALDAALAEAQRAVVAMRPDTEPGDLPEMIGRQVDDFADRFAIRAEMTTSGPTPDVEPRAQAEVLRIVQEALTNVRKHADATVVRVGLETADGFRISIADNGRGFRPEVATGGFGLESMRQRAALIGARLSVRSEPRGGTRIELLLPTPARRTANGEDTDGG